MLNLQLYFIGLHCDDHYQLCFTVRLCAFSVVTSSESEEEMEDLQWDEESSLMVCELTDWTMLVFMV